MKSAKSGGLGRVLDDILDVLSRHGEVTIAANVSGRVFEVRVQDGAAAGQVAPARAARETGRETVRGKGAGTPSAEAVFAAIAAIPVGLTLEDLAKQLGVRPRNKLKPVLAELARAGQVKKVGRKHRSTAAVVRRGRQPSAGRAAKRPGRPGRKPGRPSAPVAARRGPGRPPKAAEKPAKPGRPGRRPGRKAGRKAARVVAIQAPPVTNTTKKAAPKRRRAGKARPASGRAGKAARSSASKSNEKSNGSRSEAKAKPRVVHNRRATQRRARLLDGGEASRSSATLAPAEKTSGVASDETAE